MALVSLRGILQTPPQVVTRNRSIGPPRFTDLPYAIGAWPLAQHIKAMDGAYDSKVVDGKHVRPPQAEHQEHLGRPSTQPFHSGDGFDDLLVGDFWEAVLVQHAAPGLRGQVADVRALLAAHA